LDDVEITHVTQAITFVAEVESINVVTLRLIIDGIDIDAEVKAIIDQVELEYA